jgi:hypothetical protein
MEDLLKKMADSLNDSSNFYQKIPSSINRTFWVKMQKEVKKSFLSPKTRYGDQNIQYHYEFQVEV